MWHIIDEHGCLWRDAIALAQDLEDAPVGLDHALESRDHNALEPRQEGKAIALRREGFRRPVRDGVDRYSELLQFKENRDASFDRPGNHLGEALAEGFDQFE